MQLHQLWKSVRRQVPPHNTTSPARVEFKTGIQLLADPRAPSSVELAEMEGDSHPDLTGKTKADFFMTIGMTPELYLLRLLDAHGGELSQAELVAKTGWPPDAVSHLLTQLEQTDYLTRALSNGSLLIRPPTDDR